MKTKKCDICRYDYYESDENPCNICKDSDQFKPLMIENIKIPCDRGDNE